MVAKCFLGFCSMSKRNQLKLAVEPIFVDAAEPHLRLEMQPRCLEAIQIVYLATAVADFVEFPMEILQK